MQNENALEMEELVLNGNFDQPLALGIPGKNGKDGKDGADGKSAYKYAQEAGYVGTEAEFAEKMRKDTVWVNVTPTDDGYYLSDKSVAEIVEAYTHRQPVICLIVVDGVQSRIPLLACINNEDITTCIFTATLGGADVIVYILSENGTESANYVVIEPPSVEMGVVEDLIDEKINSVHKYGATGDGVTDDTAAFQAALAAERVVTVPGGTYMLSGTLVIRQNCCLELSQDTVLEFTQTSGNCIEMRSSATIRGNHGVIRVPYAFTGHVIDVDTVHDATRDTPPYAHFDPMWKRGRYIYDVSIVKPDPTYGLHYSLDGTCSGKAIYLSCEGAGTEVGFIWGASLHGIRIGGAFTHGIHAINFDDPNDSMEDDAWNHDMRIEAVIQGCETGVALENCNGAHLAVTVQPSTAENGTKYAKWGVYLNDAKFVDMIGSRVWDWNENSTLWTPGGQNQHLAMIGNCRGLILDDFLCHESSMPIRDLIYTDTPGNFDTMTILQEPGNKWFKSVNGEPYFNDGNSDIRLAAKNDIDEYFVTDRVPGFTDVLPSATDTDGSIYNGVGYKNNTAAFDGTFTTEKSGNLYCNTGFIPVTAGGILRGEDLSFLKANDGDCRISLFNAAREYITLIGAANLVSGGNYFVTHTGTETSFVITIKDTDGEWPINTDVAFARLQFLARAVGDNPVITVNEEIKYTQAGFLADGIKVKAENVIGSTGGGISITGATVGQTVTIAEVDENGVPTAWLPADFPSGGSGVKWVKIADVTTEEDVTEIVVSEGIPEGITGLYFRVETKYSESGTYNFFAPQINGVNPIPANLGLSTNVNYYNIIVEIHDDGSCHSFHGGSNTLITSGFSSFGEIELPIKRVGITHAGAAFTTGSLAAGTVFKVWAKIGG